LSVSQLSEFDMSLALHPQATLERTVEGVRRAVRTVKNREAHSERKAALTQLKRNPKFNNVVDDQRGYALLPAGTLPAVAPAIALAKELHAQRHTKEWPEEKGQLVVLSQPDTYEDAPAFFDLALSDDVLQIASDYLGEVPVLMRIKLWWTPVNTKMSGSQFFHRDGLDWYRRQAKFLIVMNDVGPDCGPFTFLPADISKRIGASLGRAAEQERVADEQIFSIAKESDQISLMGPAGTGGMVDSSRCFHYGARARGGERLMMVFNYMPSIEVQKPRPIYRTEGFRKRFGDDPIRNLLVPRAGK
jgi:hypothetical protein